MRPSNPSKILQRSFKGIKNLEGFEGNPSKPLKDL